MSKSLPEEFLLSTESLLGPDRFAIFMDAMEQEPPVSIRVNPRKAALPWPPAAFADGVCERVGWCEEGYYLPLRPNFTFDPLLHAGCYYVQEAASMMVSLVARSLLTAPGSFVLDLCAAPGGKSTALRSVLPPGCLLVSNEPVRQRAQVLSENMQKWGHPDSMVTNCHARDFVSAGTEGLFSLIVCDVPCSGEGMFRKDPDSIGEWSTANVARCQRLQRQIVSEIWPCLRPGGILVYSTCTYNVHENEENVRWLQEQTGADILSVPTAGEWGITGSLLKGFHAPVCRFIPGLTRSEGLFMAALRKRDDDGRAATREEQARKRLQTLDMGQTTAQKNRKHADGPTAREALSVNLDRSKYAMAELPYPTAIAYLRREAIALPEGTPTGYVIVTFRGHPLGFVKNIGPRANNLYPREWAIRSSHVPESYDEVWK